MTRSFQVDKTTIPIGYAGLVHLYSIAALPHYRNSFLIQGSFHSEKQGFEELYYYPKKYFSKDLGDPFHHIEFAIKHEGINLELLKYAFANLQSEEVEAYVRAHPTSKLARKIWYLYEYLTGKLLNLENAIGGSYTLILDPQEYYTGPLKRSRRHYVDDNLLGNLSFCPLVRRTEKLIAFEEKQLADTAKQLIEQYDSVVISRAVNYLYLKETMSSYEIEREIPDSSRSKRFVEALKKADHLGELSKAALIALQKMIVDPRYANSDYRNFQNYVGSEYRLDMPRLSIEYISPKPDDVPDMMEGLIHCLERMIEGKVHPAIIAATIAFGFVFIHPFEDGNGRIHRFLMHYIFARSKFVPNGAIFPVSAVIVKDMAAYDFLLESFSRPLLNLIKSYTFDQRGELEVKEETATHYRYLDYTHFAEYLFECVEKTICTDFKNELNYMVNYDKAKRYLSEIVDMPDKKMNLFIQFVMQNRGILSIKKREAIFSELSEEEIERMQEIVRSQMIGTTNHV